MAVVLGVEWCVVCGCWVRQPRFNNHRDKPQLRTTARNCGVTAARARHGVTLGRRPLAASLNILTPCVSHWPVLVYYFNTHT
jgi:hypothetical protein